MTFQIGVIQFPGSNCERETKLALLRAQLNPVDIFWFDDSEKLKNCDGYVIVGGFSYEDRGRSGVIAAHDPLMKALTIEAKKGKPILGICNGAQILVESGLVPGCVDENNELTTVIALTINRRVENDHVLGAGFYNAWIHMQSQNSPVIRVPVAHGEGRFLLHNDLYLYDAITTSKATCWYYTDENGEKNPNFPVNPNGSDDNLAAVGNFSGNIIAMMPHPERTAAGDIVFEQMKNYLDLKKPFHWITKSVKELSEQRGSGIAGVFNCESRGLIEDSRYKISRYTQLTINDNEAISIEMAFKKMGIEVAVQKYKYWEIEADDNDLKTIENSYELWNPKKETVLNALPACENTHYLLVTDFEDSVGQQKKERLEIYHQIQSLEYLKAGTVWKLTGSDVMIQNAIRSHLLSNPVSQTYFLFHPISQIEKNLSTQNSDQSFNAASLDPKSMIPNSRIYFGKVRNIYDEGNTLLIEATDRMSAFDRYLCDVPQKGAVLTQLSAWWFKQTAHITSNHFIEIIDHNTMRVKKCTVLPIEVVVRGFLTGSTNTSILALYEKGERQFFETRLPDGLQKNSALSTPIITPTSKSSTHDEPLTTENIYHYVTKELWEKIKVTALQLFSFGQEAAKKSGFILVDTKYEFGLDEHNNLLLIDECHTPDSSRFWLDNSFEHYDKEFLRLWYKTNCDPYGDAVLPEAPKELIQEMTRRYHYLYEKLLRNKDANIEKSSFCQQVRASDIV